MALILIKIKLTIIFLMALILIKIKFMIIFLMILILIKIRLTLSTSTQKTKRVRVWRNITRLLRFYFILYSIIFTRSYLVCEVPILQIIYTSYNFTIKILILTIFK